MKMLFLVILLLSASIFDFSYANSHRKTYPGFTYWSHNKTGEYMKIIGPVFFKILKFNLPTPPFKLGSTVSIELEFTPTIKCGSLFADGKLFSDGFLYRKSDPSKDLCMGRHVKKQLKCPWQPGRIYRFRRSFELNVLFSDTTYTIKGSLVTIDQATGEDIKLLGIDIRVII